MQQRCTYACEEVVNKKPLTSPYLFQNSPKHVQRKHIEEKVCNPSVHKHMGNQLKWPEMRRLKKVKAQSAVKVNPHITKHISG